MIDAQYQWVDMCIELRLDLEFRVEAIIKDLGRSMVVTLTSLILTVSKILDLE